MPEHQIRPRAMADLVNALQRADLQSMASCLHMRQPTSYRAGRLDPGPRESEH